MLTVSPTAVRGYRWSQGATLGIVDALEALDYSSDPIHRYVGTLHEINSETSTVALEDVTSYGTEGRKSDPSEEIPPADGLYDYIVFRGSDVKDLRIEEAPAAKENKPPQVPNDPAILGVSTRLFHVDNRERPLSHALCDEIFRMLTKHFSESANPMWRFPLPSF